MKRMTRKSVARNYRYLLALCVEQRDLYRKEHLIIAFHRWDKPSTANKIEALNHEIDVAYERAAGYLEALLDENIITCEEFREEINKMCNTMSIKNRNTWY